MEAHPVSLQCMGTTRKNARCRKYVVVSGIEEPYCHHHVPIKVLENGERVIPDQICKGVKLDKQQCRQLRKDNYDYCCSQHDPSIKYYSPSLFIVKGLRDNAERQVAKIHDNRDIYDKTIKISSLDRWDVQLDHVVERQCYSYAFVNVARRVDNEEEMEFLTQYTRDEIVNRYENLGLTLTSTNKVKGEACYLFLDDSLTGHRVKSFTTNLIEKDINRATSKEICDRMGKTLKLNQRWLDNESEIPSIELLRDELQNLYVSMELKTTHFDKGQKYSYLDNAQKFTYFDI
uniref:AlNc14C38G3329 protein n=1 Tax=Albugo laibachii Nc14 TaxID=890382 RepID=F0W962_9STRA|nr:AlNc14C38G3329 [Albugo laibachii Nc14]|eukprot:CCA17675.1 AlNc14C38G3329 [Albugo laibachii Nc14]